MYRMIGKRMLDRSTTVFGLVTRRRGPLQLRPTLQNESVNLVTDVGWVSLRHKFNPTVGPTRDPATFQIMTMNACGQASSTFDSPTRYVPGYLALTFPKPTQPIQLNWLLDGSTRPIRPSASTAGPENHTLRPTGRIPTSTKIPTTSRVSFNFETGGTDNTNPALPLIEHASRAEIHRRQQRVESELSEAWKGDIEWVRSGGVLRDSDGQRDFARTQRIREQLDEQERERKALAAWAGYEDRWRASLLIRTDRHKKSSSDLLMGDEGRDKGMGFGDVAWPVAKPPEDPEGLIAGAVREFVLAPLRGKDVTLSKRRDRIRQLLLRYHPDKTTFLLSRVTEREKDRVREGINNVFMSLKSLQGDPELQGSK